MRTALLVAFLAVWATMAWFLSWHAYSTATSDGANLILAGRDLFHGNVLLHGWTLTNDSYWTTDVVVLGAVASVVGPNETVPHLGAVIIAVGIMAVAIAVVTADARHRVLAVVPVVLILGLPTSAFLGLFLFPAHVATALFCLFSFYLLGRPTPKRVAVATVVLALATIGDASTYAVGVLPIALVAILAMTRPQLRLLGVWRFSCAAGASLIAVGVLHLVKVIGGYQQWVPPQQAAPANLWLPDLFHLSAVRLSQDIGIGRLVLAAVGVAACAVLFFAGTFRASPRDEWTAGVHVVAACGGVALFAYLARPWVGLAEARYLTPTVVFAAVCAGVAVGRLVVAGRPELVAGWIAAGVTVMAAVPTIAMAAHPAPADTRFLLVRWLEEHHLTDGIASYWDASSVTLASDGLVRSRPVITVNGRLYDVAYFSRADWFNVSPQFFVSDSRFPEAVPATAVAAFGEPNMTANVGTFHVIVWGHTNTRLPLTDP